MKHSLDNQTVDWDVLNEKPPEFLKRRQDLVYYVERAGGGV